jgi:hypothetical protein
MQDTFIAFALLGIAAAFPSPFDLATGLATLMGLMFRDRTTHGRQLAVFVWMLSRVWPALLNDSYRIYDWFMFAIGFGLYQTRSIQKIETEFIREFTFITYAVLALLPLHDAPRLATSMTFAFSACVEWYVSTTDQSKFDVILRPCMWILCIRRTNAFTIFSIAHSIWLLRQNASAPIPHVVSESSSYSSQPKTSKSASSTRSNKRIQSARVPSAYILRNSTPPALLSHPILGEEYAPDSEQQQQRHHLVDAIESDYI